jgi:hypothetical protein
MRSSYSRFAAIVPLVVAALALATPASAQFGGLKKRLKAKAAEQGVSKAAEAAGAPQENAAPNSRGGTVVLTADVVNQLLTGLKAGEADRASAAKEDTPYGRYSTAKAAYLEGKAKCEAAQPGFIQKMSVNKKVADKYSALTDKMVAAQTKGDTRLMGIYQDSAMAMQDPGCVLKEPKQPDDFYEAERQVETRSESQAVKASGLGAGEFAMAKERADGILRGPAPSDASPTEQSAVSAHAAELKPLLGIREQPAARAMKAAPAPAPAAPAAVPSAPTVPQVSPSASQMSACMSNNIQTHQAKIAALGERAQAAQAAGDNTKLMAIADTIHRIQVAGCQGR